MKHTWIVTMGLVGLLAACTSTTPAGPASTATPALDGTSWTVTGINGTAPLSGHEPTMEFAGTTVAGLASCNRYNAAFTQDGSAVTITPGVTTQMACAEDVMAQEHAFTVALTQVSGVRAVGNNVELVDASGRSVLALAAVVNQPLEGTTWTLSGLISAETVSSPVAGSSVTMTISDGTLSGKACNTFHGTVSWTQTSIGVGPLASTRMACTSAELTTQENTVLKTLEAATGYTIAGNTLTLTADDGSGLNFTAA